jgi:hypothetical protein
MALDGRQIFVWETGVDRVSLLLRRYVDRVGSAADVELDAEKWSTDRPRRTQREFTLSDARNGIITIWEDGVWGDKNVARYLSKELETRSIWLALTTMAAGGWGYVVYDNGAVVDSHARMAETIEELEKFETTERCYEEAQEFAQRHTLPFALIYLPDPSLAAMHELAKKAFQDLLAMTPELEGRVEVEYDFGSDDMEAEHLAKTEEDIEALKRLRAEVASFPKLTLPCSRSDSPS